MATTRMMSLKALLKAMHASEQRWIDEDALTTGKPLKHEEIASLRKGDKITFVEVYIGGCRVWHVTVTETRWCGYTDLNGFWSAYPEPTESTRQTLRELCGHEINTLVPSHWVLCKEVNHGYKLWHQSGASKNVLYRGWLQMEG